MRKQLTHASLDEQIPDQPWLDLERVARVELTSEDAAYPIEAALVSGSENGWRAAVPGDQTIRIIFDQPLRLQRIWLRFVERVAERTQEFVLRWSADGGKTFRDVVRQQYTFSPGGATSEVEDLKVELAGVTTMELTIAPDRGRGVARASLAQLRLA
jgi:hypothetical protein